MSSSKACNSNDLASPLFHLQPPFSIYTPPPSPSQPPSPHLPANHCGVLDSFSHKLGYAQSLASALIKLQIQNLSSMDADYLYSSYHYSHPILTERLKAIGWKGDRKVGSGVEGKKEVNGGVPEKEL